MASNVPSIEDVARFGKAKRVVVWWLGGVPNVLIDKQLGDWATFVKVFPPYWLEKIIWKIQRAFR